MHGPAQITPPVARQPSAPGRASAMPTDEVRQAAQEFESLLIGQILHGLMDSLSGPGMLGEGKDEVYASMLQDEYARLISRSGGIGIADVVMRELLKAQEAG